MNLVKLQDTEYTEISICILACVLSRFSHVYLFVTPEIASRQAPLSMGFSQQEYWSGLPCPPLRGLPEPGIELTSPVSPALQVGSLPLSHWGSLKASNTCNFRGAIRIRSLGWEHPLEEGMATHSSILAWRIPWTEEPGGLQFIGSQRVRHD